MRLLDNAAGDGLDGTMLVVVIIPGWRHLDVVLRLDFLMEDI
jgi:hypothetical protein